MGILSDIHYSLHREIGIGDILIIPKGTQHIDIAGNIFMGDYGDETQEVLVLDILYSGHRIKSKKDIFLLKYPAYEIDVRVYPNGQRYYLDDFQKQNAKKKVVI